MGSKIVINVMLLEHLLEQKNHKKYQSNNKNESSLLKSIG